MREQNPKMDTLLLGGVMIGGLIVLAKVIAGIKLPGPGDILGGPGNKHPNVQIVGVKHPPYPGVGTAPFDVEWTINHKGPAGRYPVGVAVVFPTGEWGPQYESELIALDDSDWRSYTWGMTFMALGGGPFIYLLAYVKDGSGTTLAELRV